MCGLFGWMDTEGKLSSSQRILLSRSLALAAAGRGRDATGYATLESGKIMINKAALPAQLFPITPGDETPVMLGHTRLATIGDPTRHDQAHPFLSQCGTYALAHNGVATLDYLHLKRFIRGCKTGVDSEAMLRYLEMHGMDASDLARFYRDWSDSGFALVILDQKAESVVFFRNSCNPLFFATVESVPGLKIYGSTEALIKTALDSAGMTPSQLYSLEPNTRLEISFNGHESTDDIDVPEAELDDKDDFRDLISRFSRGA